MKSQWPDASHAATHFEQTVTTPSPPEKDFSGGFFIGAGAQVALSEASGAGFIL
jgi:hypothetical protein